MDCSLPGSSVHGIFQARVLEWGAIAYRSLLQLPGHGTLIRCGPIRVFSLGWQSVCLLSLLSKGKRGKAIWINCWSPWCFPWGQNRPWCHNNLHLSFQCQPSWHPHNTCFSIRSPPCPLMVSLVAGKESACNVGDLGLIPELGRSLGEGKGYPLQYFGLENPMGCIVHGGHRELHTTETEWLSLLLFKMLVYVDCERGLEHLAMITLYHHFFLQCWW